MLHRAQHTPTAVILSLSKNETSECDAFRSFDKLRMTRTGYFLLYNNPRAFVLLSGAQTRAVILSLSKDLKPEYCHPELVEGSKSEVKPITKTIAMYDSHEYYVYIMGSSNGRTIYIGVTNDLRRRVAEHKSDKIDGFTRKYKCHQLLYFECYTEIKMAIAREKQLKGWTRMKKETLIKEKNPERIDLFIQG